MMLLDNKKLDFSGLVQHLQTQYQSALFDLDSCQKAQQRPVVNR
jgi:hypothetical protein